MLCQEDDRDILVTSCRNACLLCDLDGYVYENDAGLIAAVYLRDSCREGLGNLMAFVAATAFLTLEIMISDCYARDSLSGGELENWTWFTVMEATGPFCLPDGGFDGFARPVFPCSLDNQQTNGIHRLEEGQAKVFSNTVPLNVGQVYYIKIGGTAGVSCINSIRVLEGSTAIPELTFLALDNTSPTCVGNTETYRVLDPPVATSFAFTVGGDTLSTTDSLEITWTVPGEYELCISGKNPCSEPIMNCYNISVSELPPTDTTVYLCPGACYDLSPNRQICSAGTYEQILQDDAGCLFTRITHVLNALPDTTRLFATICSGDTLNYRGRAYFIPGSYSFLYANVSGCDSTVFLEVFLRACPLGGSIRGQDIICHGSSDGQLSFRVNSGAPPFDYSYRRLGGGPNGQGSVAGTNLATIIAGLIPGTYLVEVSDNFGSEGFFNVEILQPDALVASSLSSNYNGYGTSCAGGTDGDILLSISGGVGPYSTIWSDDASVDSTRRDQLPAGQYQAQIMDANGCDFVLEKTISSPVSMSATFTVLPERCGEVGTGSVSNVDGVGGVGSYQIALLSPDEEAIGSFTDLTTGQYALRIMDANDCVFDTSLVVERPEYVPANISASATLLSLGESARLSASIPVAAQLEWRSSLVVCQH